MAELTNEQIRLEQEKIAILNEQLQITKDLGSMFQKMAKFSSQLTAEQKEILSISKLITSESSNIEKSIQKRLDGTASVKDLEKSLQKLKQDAIKREHTDFTSLEREREKAYNTSISLTTRLTELKDIHRDQEIKLSNLVDERNRAERLGQLDVVRNLQSRIIEEKRTQIENEKNIALTEREYKIQTDISEQLQETIRLNDEINEQQEQEINLLKQAIKEKKKEEILNFTKKQLRWEEIKDMFTLVGLFTIIKNSALRFNNISVQIGKSLGYSADGADRVTSNLVSIAQRTGDVNVTLKSASEAMNELNTATGGVAEYSSDALKTQIMLTKQFGLTGEQASGIYRLSILTGKSSDEVNKAMVRGFVTSRNQLKTSADFRTTIAAASTVSGQLAMNLKNNPEAIVKAVVATQALGSSLEKAKSQGEALLNWESSIENELKAELLTGQQMNLERARAAALMGDQVTVAQELANQGMNIEKYQSMNVLAQQSFAAALGLSSDELSNQLTKQKIAQEQGKSLAQITEEDAIAAQKRQNIQDKFNVAIEKLQDLLGNLVAGPVAKLLSFMTDILSSTYALSAIMGVYIGKLVYSLAVKTASWIMSKRETQANLVNASLTAAQSAAKVPVIGHVLGIAAGLATFAAFAGMMSKAGDMYSPADGKTQVSTKEGGLFELSPNDDLIAAPGLYKGSRGISGSSINIEPLISAINNVRASVDKLYAKEGVVYLDGDKVGTVLMQGSYKSV